MTISLKARIIEARNEARKARQDDVLKVMQSVIADIEKREKAGDRAVELTDAEVLGVLEKAAETRKETAAIFRKAGRDERAEIEEKEVLYISRFIPEKMSREETEALVLEFVEKNDLKGTGMKSMKIIMGEFNQNILIDRSILADVAKSFLV